MKSLIFLCMCLFCVTVQASSDVPPSSVLFVLSNTNELSGQSVDVKGTVLSVEREGLSTGFLIVKLDGCLFVRVAVPPGSRWVGGKLCLNHAFPGMRPVYAPWLTSGQSVVVTGVLGRKLSRWYLDPAKLH